jgi:hypothetical protein
MSKNSDDIVDTHKPPLPPPVFATQAATGLGKTKIWVEELAEDRQHPRPDGAPEMYQLPSAFLVPTHRLGQDVAELFRARGLSARVYRSREAKTADGKPMCLQLDRVKLAKDCHVDIETTCCKGVDPKGNERRCEDYARCPYQAQFSGEDEPQPDVWIAAHQMLFHDQGRFGMSLAASASTRASGRRVCSVWAMMPTTGRSASMISASASSSAPWCLTMMMRSSGGSGSRYCLSCAKS